MKALAVGLALAAVAGCGTVPGRAVVADDEMQGLLEKMEQGQKAHDLRLRDWSIVYMSLARMFPDEDTRALARAAGRGRLGRIDELVAAGVDVNDPGRSDGTALWWALRKRNLEGFTRQLELGADPNQSISGPHYDPTTVMHEAAWHPNPAFLAAALKHGGDPNVRAGSDDATPLFNASEICRCGCSWKVAQTWRRRIGTGLPQRGSRHIDRPCSTNSSSAARRTMQSWSRNVPGTAPWRMATARRIAKKSSTGSVRGTSEFPTRGRSRQPPVDPIAIGRTRKCAASPNGTTGSGSTGPTQHRLVRTFPVPPTCREFEC